jgi:hydrogenase expression/formation protein HypC
MCLAIPGEVIEIAEEKGLRTAKVRFGGLVKQVCLECVPETQVGDYVLVHVGLAIARVDRDEAQRTYDTLQDLGMTSELTPPGDPP